VAQQGGHVHLGLMQSRGVQGRLVSKVLAHRVAGLAEALDAELDELGGDAQIAFGALDCLGQREVEVALAGSHVEGVEDSGLDARRVFGLDAHGPGDAVGGEEADAAHIAGEEEWAALDHLDGLVAIASVDATGQGAADAVLVEEDHDPVHRLVALPGLPQGSGPHGPDAGCLLNAIRGVLEDVEGIVAEVGHELLGRLGADALHQAAAEVRLNRPGRGRPHELIALETELQPIALVPLPGAKQPHGLPGLRGDHGAHDGHGLRLPVGHEAGDSPAGVG